MSQFQGFPPQKLLASRQISRDEAHEALANFLRRAETDSSLYENAMFKKSGPEAIADDPGSNMHALRQLEAGLRGEHIDNYRPYRPLGSGASRSSSSLRANGAKRDEKADGKGKGKDGRKGGGEAHAAAKGVEDMDWQDRSEYEREQAAEEGEIEPRTQHVEDGVTDDVPAIHATKNPKAIGAEADKAARKAAKKERRKKERREEEAKRKAQT